MTRSMKKDWLDVDVVFMHVQCMYMAEHYEMANLYILGMYYEMAEHYEMAYLYLVSTNQGCLSILTNL